MNVAQMMGLFPFPTNSHPTYTVLDMFNNSWNWQTCIYMTYTLRLLW